MTDRVIKFESPKRVVDKPAGGGPPEGTDGAVSVSMHASGFDALVRATAHDIAALLRVRAGDESPEVAERMIAVADEFDPNPGT